MPGLQALGVTTGVALASMAVAEPVCDDPCMPIRQAIAVMGATMAGCDRAFPAAHGAHVMAFKNWKLLKYRIPGRADVLAGKTSDLANARAMVANDFNSPIDDQAIECEGCRGRLDAQDPLVPAALLAPYAPLP